MTPSTDVRAVSAPPLTEAARGLLGWVSCHNPFYVISACLFLVGLRVSFDAKNGEVETWTLLSGLAGYTLLLALTAFLLVRDAKDWQDLRTVLLLVVLMFLATSVTFDEVLVVDPERGVACYLVGLAFTMLLSEWILRGIRLALPPLFRAPYYAILALFFLYPLALRPFVNQPHSPELLWGLFAFSSVAGLLFLTLLPAIRRGPQYVQGNGSPWIGRFTPGCCSGCSAWRCPRAAFLLCWSMHLLPAHDLDQLIFGPYFLIPFGFAVAVLVLEIGLVSARPVAIGTALAMPLGLVALGFIGHRDDAIYREFLGLFTGTLGGHPIYLTLLASVAYYAYAALRRVPLATEALTLALVASAIVAPDGVIKVSTDRLLPAPILAAAVLQLVLGWRRCAAWRCLLAGLSLVAVVAILLPKEIWAGPWGVVIVFHLALLTLFVVGAIFQDQASWWLRRAAAVLVTAACVATMFGGLSGLPAWPAWSVVSYPLVMAALLASYGLLLSHRLAVILPVWIVACWLARVSWWGYVVGRHVMAGMDQLALSMALFIVAVTISLGKAGMLKGLGWQRSGPCASPASGPNEAPPV